VHSTRKFQATLSERRRRSTPIAISPIGSSASDGASDTGAIESAFALTEIKTSPIGSTNWLLTVSTPDRLSPPRQFSDSICDDSGGPFGGEKSDRDTMLTADDGSPYDASTHDADSV
jgi:hypothetical protein